LEKCVGSRVHLVGISISFENIFYRLPFTPPSGSPYRSFTSARARGQARGRIPASATLCATIAREASARDERARELGKLARESINTNFNVDDPNAPPRASQKLIAAATLLRAMPAPSTPEACNLHREAQALIEQEAVQQAKSSASRICRQGSLRDDGGTQGQEASVHVGGAAGQPANQGRCQSGSRSLTRVDKLRMATPATS
jgi:hypothetical protein